MDVLIIDVIKVFLPAIFAFTIGIIGTPLLTHYLYAHKIWKKSGGKKALDGSQAEEFNKLHSENETKTPRMGGIVIWGSVVATVFIFGIVASLTDNTFLDELNIISRNQTWLPLVALLIGASVGFINDLLDVTTETARGISLRTRLIIVGTVSLFAGWWFFDKLDVTSIGIPFHAPLEIGWLIVPLFVLVSLFFYASGVIDGIDGLAGGVFALIFGAYASIAFFQNQIDLAAFSATIAGGILAFLWFNIPPARFWMTETGTMALTMTLTVVAFMTDTLGDGHGFLTLGIIALPLSATVLSNIAQISSKKFRGKKLLRVAPLHHHFEAIGWPSYKVTMRYWVITAVLSFVGVVFALLG